MRMTKERAAEAIKILQAFIGGEKIEFKEEGDCEWELCNAPGFNFNNYEYRIRQKSPQEIAKKQAEVMLAYVNGEIIEVKTNADRVWREVEIPTWNWFDNDYRVKP